MNCVHPLTNVILSAPDHTPLEVDFYWPAHRLVVELDGFATHGTRTVFEQDRQRDAALLARGDRVLRFTWRAVTADRATVRRRLEAAAARAA